VPEFATVHAVTLADLSAWHDRTVTPNNMILGISGDFNTAEMEAKLRAAFEPLARGPDFVSVKSTFPGPTPGVYLANKSDVNQSNVWIVGLGTERSNPDYYALSVMNTVFSGGFGSRLFQDVRTRLGLAYSVEGAYGASYDHPGFSTLRGNEKRHHCSGNAGHAATDWRVENCPANRYGTSNAKDQVLNSWIFHFDSPEKYCGSRRRLPSSAIRPTLLRSIETVLRRSRPPM